MYYRGSISKLTARDFINSSCELGKIVPWTYSISWNMSNVPGSVYDTDPGTFQSLIGTVPCTDQRLKLTLRGDRLNFRNSANQFQMRDQNFSLILNYLILGHTFNS